MDYKGKHVYTDDELSDWKTVQVGDYFNGEVVMSYMDMLPPVSFRTDCAQVGEPNTIRVDEKTGRPRYTYTTFKLVDAGGESSPWTIKGVWQYCGDCFVGETTRRGTELSYVETEAANG